MPAVCPKYVPRFLVSVLVVTAACTDSNGASPTAPATVERATVERTIVTAEPVTVAPEFLPVAFCPRWPPFGARLVIVVHAGDDLIIRGLRFEFVDRFGDKSMPIAIPIPISSSGSVPVPTSVPVPLPGSSPIPVPGTSPIPVPGFAPLHGLPVSAGASRRLPFFLEFSCGVPAGGTLFIAVETSDRRGMSGSSRLSVRIG